jgi:molybdopterin converting factor small subunit
LSATPAHEIFLNLFEKEKEKGEKFLKSIRVAINCEYVKSNAMVQAGDEIAFIPPVSGG